jgi:hypothetical protein
VINRALLKQKLDQMPEEEFARVVEFIRFQKSGGKSWRDDTEYLSAIPGMVESIVEGMNAPRSAFFDTLE